MIKTIIVLLIIGLIGYSAFLVAVPYYNYFAFKSDIEEYLKVAIDFKARIIDDIYEMSKEYDIPIEKDDIDVTRLKSRIYDVQISWSVTVDFFTLYQKTFFFDIDTGT
jgi:hypothetical protein